MVIACYKQFYLQTQINKAQLQLWTSVGLKQTQKILFQVICHNFYTNIQQKTDYSSMF